LNQELRANLRKQDEESSKEDASKDDDHESQQDDEESTTANQHGHDKPAIPFWAYIETLPAWERDLLLSVVIFPEWDNIINQEGTKILGVGDGGNKDNYGSFGWAIASNMEPKTNLVQNSGLARGQPMSSHRAEAYGRISILLFLVRHEEYRGKPYSTSLQAITYCDNSGVEIL
jgi:hypothetical protein